SDGPFAETKELIAGFWLWQVRSMDEAIEWLQRAPFQDCEIEIRTVFEAEDFGAEFTPELSEQEEHLRQQPTAGTLDSLRRLTATPKVDMDHATSPQPI